jgi:FixJ family two-component response regulator
MEPRGLLAVVDDEAPVRTALQRLLYAEGFTVDAHPSATDFLQAVRVRRPDCLLLDIHMPGMGGFQLLETLRSMAVAFPAIVLTADCSPPIVSRAHELGALHCLSKSVEAEILIEAIDGALRSA